MEKGNRNQVGTKSLYLDSLDSFGLNVPPFFSIPYNFLSQCSNEKEQALEVIENQISHFLAG